MQFTRGILLKAEGAAGRSAPLLLSELSWGLGLGDCSSFPRIVANFIFFNQCMMMGCPPGGKGKRLGDPPAAPPDALEVRPPSQNAPALNRVACSPWRLLLRWSWGRGPGWSMHSRGRCPQCDWHNLDVFTRVDGRGCPMAHGDLRRLYLGGGRVGGRGLWPLPLHPGAQVGVRGPGVSAGVVVSVAYY